MKLRKWSLLFKIEINIDQKRRLSMTIWKRILLLVTLLSLCIVEAKRSESGGGRSGRKRNRGNKGERRKGGKGRKNRNKANKTPSSTSPSSTGGVKPSASGSRAIWQGMSDHFWRDHEKSRNQVPTQSNFTPCFCIWSFFQKETFLAFFGPTLVAHTHIRADTRKGNILSCF